MGRQPRGLHSPRVGQVWFTVFSWVQGDIGNTFVVQAHHAQLQQKLRQRPNTVRKLPPKGPEGDEHTDGHLIIDHQAGAQPQYDDLVTGRHEGVDPTKQHVHFGDPDIGIDGIDFQVEPVGDTAFRHALHLDRGDTVQRLHEIRAGASISHQRLFGQLAVIAVGQQAHQHVDSSKGKHHPGQPATIQHHHHQHANHHDAVHDGADDTGGEGAAQRIQRAEA